MLTLSGPSNPATVTTSDITVVLTAWFVRLVKVNEFGVVSWERVVTDQFATSELTVKLTFAALSNDDDEATRSAMVSPTFTFAAAPIAVPLTTIVAPGVTVAVRSPAKPVSDVLLEVMTVLGSAFATALNGPLNAGVAPTSCQDVPSQNWTDFWAD